MYLCIAVYQYATDLLGPVIGCSGGRGVGSQMDVSYGGLEGEPHAAPCRVPFTKEGPFTHTTCRKKGCRNVPRRKRNMDVPRVIWLLWLQGWEQAPVLQRMAAQSWKRHNPSWDVRLIDRWSLKHYIDDRYLQPMSTLVKARQAASDMIRLLLLSQHGGVWVDATALCMVSLDMWLPEVRGDFWTFTAGRDTSTLPECTWFIVASPRSELIQAWRRSAIKFWRNHTKARAVRYLWMDSLFKKFIGKRNRTLDRLWQAVTPRIACQDPVLGGQLFQRAQEWLQPVAPGMRRHLTRCTPHVLKLSRQYMWRDDDTQSATRFAINISRRADNKLCRPRRAHLR